MTPAEHIAGIKAALVAAPIAESFEIVEEWALPDRGYLRARRHPANGDFVAASEYFVVSGAACVTRRYRHQWMDGTRQQMRRRWDNVEHHPNLSAFPHHVHYPDGRVEPGRCFGIVSLLSLLAAGAS